MAEQRIIQYNCSKCKKLNYPYGQMPVDLPRHEQNICEFCGNKDEMNYLDSRLEEEMVRKQLKLNSSRVEYSVELEIKIQKIEERLSRSEEKNSKLQLEIYTIKQQQGLEQQARTILENEIAKLRAFQERYEKDLLTLETLIQLKTIEKQDADRFQEENK